MSIPEITRHARDSMVVRQIAETDVRRILAKPMRVVPGNRAGRLVYEGLAADRRRPECLAAGRRDGVCYHPVSTLRSNAVRIDYDAETDSLRIVLRDVPVRESEEERSGVILDDDTDGKLVALELLDASTRVDTVDAVQLKVRQPAKISDAAE